MGLCIIIMAMEVLAVGVDGNHWGAKSKDLLQLFLGELTGLIFLPVGWMMVFGTSGGMAFPPGRVGNY